jgi:hypothetical protein
MDAAAVNITSFILFIQELKVFLDNQIGKPIKCKFKTVFFHLLDHKQQRIKYSIVL